MLEPWLAHLIESTRVARLGTIARDGRPNLVPVCFAYPDGGFIRAIGEVVISPASTRYWKNR